MFPAYYSLSGMVCHGSSILTNTFVPTVKAPTHLGAGDLMGLQPCRTTPPATPATVARTRRDTHDACAAG
jgi:hypothetical protein